MLKNKILYGMAIWLFCLWGFLSVPVYAQNDIERFEAVLLPVTETILSSSLAGYIQKINIEEGYAFQKDDVLIEFDCQLYEMELKRLTLEQKIAIEKLKTTKELFTLKAASKMDLLLADIELKKSKLEKEKQQYLLEGCQITAPFDGYAVEFYISPYQTIPASYELVRLVNGENLKLELFVSSNHLSKFVSGSKFDFYVNETKQSYQAQVVAIVPLIDSVSQTFKVIAKLNFNDPMLLPGMSGTVKVEK
ncbi:MAG: efflux RND transporter periplasmic adaptor subunit [Alphaproteobacteria bacterium]|nr:efflux RND transporter periplasmic adaptor subunit [Alphaproteobacteria bacterium]